MGADVAAGLFERGSGIIRFGADDIADVRHRHHGHRRGDDCCGEDEFEFLDQLLFWVTWNGACRPDTTDVAATDGWVDCRMAYMRPIKQLLTAMFRRWPVLARTPRSCHLVIDKREKPGSR